MNRELHSNRLAIFDIDGTLTEIKPAVKEKYPRRVTPRQLGEQQPIPGVVETLAAIQASGLEVALATNRGGVAFGITTLDLAHELAQEAAELCQIPRARIYLCPYHAKARGFRAIREFARDSECRKPNPGMLIQAAEDHGVDLEQAFFVGDMDTDRQAAENAGMDFYWASEFFK